MLTEVPSALSDHCRRTNDIIRRAVEQQDEAVLREFAREVPHLMETLAVIAEGLREAEEAYSALNHADDLVD
jgi:hypothetical protein